MSVLLVLWTMGLCVVEFAEVLPRFTMYLTKDVSGIYALCAIT